MPWHNSHLYWDGSYGACCFETIPPAGQRLTLSNSSLEDWHNSEAMQNFRQRMLGNEPLPECAWCYYEEKHGHESKRIKENFKVAIFTKEAFQKSFLQSPWYSTFQLATKNHKVKLPIDLHLNFGNECNLACKMCNSQASSKFASHMQRWQIPVKAINNWTNDNNQYQQLLKNIQSIPTINRIHIMGGEPLINKRFREFLAWLIDNNYSNLSFSFVSNGTILNEKLIEDLKFFRSVDIEISIESIEDNNHYIRQGTDTRQVLSNILTLKNHVSDSFNVILRTAPQLFSINNYHKLILFAYENRLSVQSVPVQSPNYLSIDVLPMNIKEKFISNYENLKLSLEKNVPNIKELSTGRNVARLEQQLIHECDSMINLLKKPSPDIITNLQAELIYWIKKWDMAYSLDAKEYFPEYKLFLETCGY